MSGSFFGTPGTGGERENQNLFRRGMRTLDSATLAFELLAVQLYVADVRSQFENGHCTFQELDNARELAKKLIDKRFQEKEEEKK